MLSKELNVFQPVDDPVVTIKGHFVAHETPESGARWKLSRFSTEALQLLKKIFLILFLYLQGSYELKSC
jgi:hypothetical protein